jgi:glycosyltransferase involved in cell wall biosynthesis
MHPAVSYLEHKGTEDKEDSDMKDAQRSLVSVVIPTHNRAKLLPAALHSVLTQTYRPIEIIVVDDGSTDNTAEVVTAFGPRVKYIRQENSGVEHARRRGLQASTGAFVNFLDDDDWFGPDKIARQIALFEAHPEYGVVHCDYDYVDAEGNWMESATHQPDGDVRHLLAWGCFPWSGGPLVRRECFKVIPPDCHHDWYGDWGLWLRISLAGYRWGCVHEPVGAYRMLAGSMIESRTVNAERLVFNILDTVFASNELLEETRGDRDAIYAGWHCWLAWRYYAGGNWDSAKRSLAAAIALDPSLRESGQVLAARIYWDAVSPRMRVHDPHAFVQGIFDHLPEAAAMLAPLREQVLMRVNSTLALQRYAAADVAAGREQLARAVAAAPGMLDDAEAFADTVLDRAMGQRRVQPYVFAELLYDNLPDNAAPLRRSRGRVLGLLAYEQASRLCEQGALGSVPQHLMTALRHYPPLLANRGFLSMLVRSPAWLRAGRRAAETGAGANVASVRSGKRMPESDVIM